MEQPTSSQPGEEATGTSTKIIKSPKGLEQLLKTLDGLPTKPPSIYLDVSSSNQEELLNLQLLVLPTNEIYVVDIKSLGTTALSAVGEEGEFQSLRLVLESKTITKVGFDIRDMSRLLFHQFNVSLGGIYDLQLMELASREDGKSKRLLSGLAKCVDIDVPNSDATKLRWVQPNATTNLHMFNSLGHALNRSIRRVEMFPILWKIYRRRLGKPGEAFWLAHARCESQERVERSKSNSASQYGRHLGPDMWWDRDRREAAIDDWNDELLLEIRFGAWKLNDDAEWVPDHSRDNEDWLFDS
ncbi:putative 3 -5 exonuclease protein [Fusarium flagelliforme]|uniref:Putative 3-5 exonuclease protein n=1 Tax=Fusarium flagelliforme TaxID=2675880 RepID=A0A395MWX5_9HYPO|nr:putative 3 -5 exonuclease protein [Fusarium flagelliforme]